MNKQEMEYIVSVDHLSGYSFEATLTTDTKLNKIKVYIETSEFSAIEKDYEIEGKINSMSDLDLEITRVVSLLEVLPEVFENEQ